jgi:hypothetical protein
MRSQTLTAILVWHSRLANNINFRDDEVAIIESPSSDFTSMADPKPSKARKPQTIRDARTVEDAMRRLGPDFANFKERFHSFKKGELMKAASARAVAEGTPKPGRLSARLRDGLILHFYQQHPDFPEGFPEFAVPAPEPAAGDPFADGFPDDQVWEEDTCNDFFT